MPFFAEMGFGMTETYMAKDDGIRSFIKPLPNRLINNNLRKRKWQNARRIPGFCEAKWLKNNNLTFEKRQ